MRKLLLTLLSALFATAAWAGPEGTVYVELNDGTTVDIRMSDKLSLRFNATHLVASDPETNVEIPKEKIVAFSHSINSSAIEGVAGGSTAELAGRSMHFTGLADATVITVHNLRGDCVLSAMASGDFTLSLDELAPAVYLVSVNNVSYKIALR